MLSTAVIAGLAGCLGPQVSDELMVETPVYQSAEEVPAVEDDPDLARQLRTHQGFSAGEREVSCDSLRLEPTTTPPAECADSAAASESESDPDALEAPGTTTIRSLDLQWGFVHGHWAWFWDFGPGTLFLAPVYMLVSHVSLEPLDFIPIPNHPPLFGLIPGQTGYTPLWQVVLVPTTQHYNQERITSVGAIQAGREAGILGNPVPLDMVVDCPIVHGETFLEVWNADWNPKAQYQSPKTAYWEGQEVSYFDLGVVATNLDVTSGVAGRVLTLRREGEEPLDEALRGVDMTGDGDLDDTNHIFDSEPGDEGYTPMVAATEVVVEADTVSLDNKTDEVGPAFTDIDEVVDDHGTPVSDKVVALYPQSTLRYLPRWVPKASEPAPEPDIVDATTDAEADSDSDSEADIGPALDAAAAAGTSADAGAAEADLAPSEDLP